MPGKSRYGICRAFLFTAHYLFKEKTMKQYIELNEFGLWIDAIAELIKKGVTFRAFIKPDTGASCPYFIELTGGY
jgi:hypothetical protein